MFRVGGRLVKVVTGSKSQTVNICTERNREGVYAHIVRLYPPHFVEEATLAGHRFRSPEDLVRFLCERHNGVVEVAPATRPVAATAAPHAVTRRFDDDPWVCEALPRIDACVNAFVEGFVRYPFLHRVEHSQHCELYALLTGDEVLGATTRGRGFVTRLVHKEWPEWRVRDEKGRRGNSDLVVLSPATVRSCTVQEFLDGRIEPPVVIEVGLNYPTTHLLADFRKLCASGVHRGYLVHLVNRDYEDDYHGLERRLPEIERSHPNIRTAYARVVGPQPKYKLVGDGALRDAP